MLYRHGDIVRHLDDLGGSDGYGGDPDAPLEERCARHARATEALAIVVRQKTGLPTTEESVDRALSAIGRDLGVNDPESPWQIADALLDGGSR